MKNSIELKLSKGVTAEIRDNKIILEYEANNDGKTDLFNFMDKEFGWFVLSKYGNVKIE